ncbi:MAG: hypothetical protein KJ043_01275 [Anaerolineae bacterium]|nr:hypothetical protein [Anaerolineae bacterium]
MSVADILEQAKQLELDELDELAEQILDLRIHRKQQIHQPKTGAELVALLKKMGPIELVDPHIEDPVEWVQAQRQKEADRLKPYWGDKEE